MNHRLLFIIFLIFSVASMADNRRYVWTYEYLTVKAGDAELESYSTIYHKETDSTIAATTILMEELEVGMTPRFDVGIYQAFRQLPGLPLTYDGFKIRFRYRFGEKGSWAVDPLFYFEYKDTPDFSHTTFETKLILAKDVGRLNIAVNPVLEMELDRDRIEIEWEYASGISYRFSPILIMGLEFTGGEAGHYLGPTLSHGRGDLWFAIGGGYLINGETSSPDFKLRLILGVGF